MGRQFCVGPRFIGHLVSLLSQLYDLYHTHMMTDLYAVLCCRLRHA